LFAAIEHAQKSRYEPEVVTSVPSAGARRRGQGSARSADRALARGPGLDPAEYAGKLKSPETPSPVLRQDILDTFVPGHR